MVMLFVLVISEIVIKIFSPKHFTYFVWPMSKITIFVIAVLIFGVLKGVKVKMTPWLLCCSQSVFGVYLYLHINLLFICCFCFMRNYRSTEVILCRTPSKANIIQAVKLV